MTKSKKDEEIEKIEIKEEESNLIPVFRSSGFPVDPDLAEEFFKKRQVKFDKIIEDSKKAVLNLDSLNLDDAEKRKAKEDIFQESKNKIDELDNQLNEKYNKKVDWKFISDRNEWLETIKKFGPITIGLSQETNELMYLINDTN